VAQIDFARELRMAMDASRAVSREEWEEGGDEGRYDHEAGPSRRM
jgi:hypothetical protein